MTQPETDAKPHDQDPAASGGTGAPAREAAGHGPGGGEVPGAESPGVTAAQSTPPTGLTEAEAQRRRAAGQSNEMPLKTSRSYGRIVRENVFNFINNVLFFLGALLIALGRYLDALISVGVVALNTVVSLIQEIRAKMLLDRIAILTRPKATVVRDGTEREVDPGEIVLGDLLALHAGDQVVVDGPMVGSGHMEMDESLLTGESDLVPKRPGDPLLSGSFCVTGGGTYVAEKVGADCYVNKLSSGAQAFRRVLTPLQHQVNIIIRSLVLLALGFEILVVVKAFIDDNTFTQTVRDSTVIVALIPNGLILAIALAYALGAVRMAGKGALVQQGNAIESMSNVDVLCTDKTGTLTTNSIRYHDVEPFAVDRAELERLLGDYAANTTEGNRTTDAVGGAFKGRPRTVVDEAVFSSARKWSALTFDGDGLRGTYVLGAPEMMAQALRPGSDLGPKLEEWTNGGLRVLLFAATDQPAMLYERDETGERRDGEPALPAGLEPLALVSLSDELRPKVQETLRELAAAHVDLKIISGDNPQTVAALARQAGLDGEIEVLSGTDLDAMDDDELRLAAEGATVFGRVTPQQKERLVGALRDNGHYVAMIGDGVNDVISLKRANVGIAMQGGSQAARAVADMILLKDSFGALPWAFQEGQRIFNGMQDILRIFMVRIMSKALLIGAVGFLGGFAFQPRQASLLSFFSAGIPAIALAAFAKPGKSNRDRVLYDLMRFVLPATIIMSLIGIGIFAGYILWGGTPAGEVRPGAVAVSAGGTLYMGQTMITAFFVFCALLLLPMTVPPTRFWTGGATLRKDWKMTILAVLLLAGFLAVALSKLGRVSFDLAQLGVKDFAIAGVAAVVWSMATLWVWRHQIFEQFLGLPREGPGGAPGVGEPPPPTAANLPAAGLSPAPRPPGARPAPRSPGAGVQPPPSDRPRPPDSQPPDTPPSDMSPGTPTSGTSGSYLPHRPQ
jgi:cation-transporting P-type ATPase E